MTALRVCLSFARCLVLAAAALVACSVGNPVAVSVTDGGRASPSVEEGGRFAQARKCAQCHQSDRGSDGVLSGQSTALPGTHAFGRNLTPDIDTGIGGWSDDAVLRAIRSGVNEQGAPLCAPMPHFTSMGDGEGEAIVTYLRSLPPVARAIPASDCAAADDDAGDSAELPPAEAGAPSTMEASAPVWDGGGGVLIVDADAGGACTLLAPSVPAACTGCTATTCQPNGCYGGSWCDAVTGKCHRRPATCP